MAPMNGAVRDYQRRLAQLASAHAKARARLDAAVARRAELIADQDRLVAEAQASLHRAVAEIAATFGAEAAADLVGMAPAEVRRIAKAGGQP